MRGIIADAKTGKVQQVDDGLPMPAYTPYTEPMGIDLAIVAQKLKDIDQVKIEIEDLKLAMKSLQTK